MAKAIIVFTTLGNMREAEIMAKKIVENKLGSCVQLEKINSFFNWKGEIDSFEEIKISIKTFEDKYNDLKEFIKNNSSYDLPEIVSFSMDNVSEEYLNWMKEVVYG